MKLTDYFPSLTRECTEKFLWSGVMEQAIDDLHDEDWYIREQAEVWFKADGRRAPLVKYDKQSRWDGEGCDPQIGNFEWICTELGLEPGAVREKVLKELELSSLIENNPNYLHPQLEIYATDEIKV